MAVRHHRCDRLQTSPSRIGGCTSAIMNSELCIDCPHVPTNCISTNKKRRRDFPVLVALGKQCQYFFLPPGEFAGVVRGKVLAAHLGEKESGCPQFAAS